VRFACLLLLILTGCDTSGKLNVQPPAVPATLKPASSAPRPVRGAQYVPIYSSIYWGAGVKKDLIELTATLSIRNVSLQSPIVLDSVDYYNSVGSKVRSYLPSPMELGPMASAEFVIMRADTSGGPGANFLVYWSAVEGAEEPLTEAVMLGQSGSAGISFLTSGKPVKR
jgi:hypothetical protein